MHITIMSGGSRGDVQPYVALGKGLLDAGHTVRVLSSDDFEGLVTDYGLDFVSTGGSAQAVARQMQSMLGKGNMLKMLSQMRVASEKQAVQSAILGLQACQGSDLIIGGLGGIFNGMALAEKLSIPFMAAYLVPFSPTRAFPGVLLPVPQTPLTRWLNKPSHYITQQTMWQSFRSSDNLARREVLHMPPASFWGPFSALKRQKLPVLYGYSAAVISRPDDWDALEQVTGYWFLPPPADWTPPTDLLRFLEAGPPPVYIGFGSMISNKPEEAGQMALDALARTGQRGILYAGWGGLKGDELPANVFMTESVPHTWLFPRMAAVVHHGGVGTTAAGLAAGVPSFITPFFGDQPFWGRRIHELGVGPKHVARRDLTTEHLTQAIQEMVSDQTMRQRAAALGERIRAEDGVANAIHIIENHITALK